MGTLFQQAKLGITFYDDFQEMHPLKLVTVKPFGVVETSTEVKTTVLVSPKIIHGCL